MSTVTIYVVSELPLADGRTQFTLECTCPSCGKTNRLELSMNKAEFLTAYVRFMNGVCIQNAFPNLTIDEREFFLTGNCPCLADVFAEE